MRKNVFLTFIVFALFISGYSQTPTIKEFSTNSDEEFLKDYITFSSTHSNPAVKTEANQFSASFGEFSSSEKVAFMKLANDLLTLKGKPFPNFLQLNKTINKVVASDDKKHLNQHLLAINWVANNSTGNILKKVEDYLAFTENFATQGNLYSSSTRNARLVNFDYTYKINSDGPVITFSKNNIIHFTKGDTIDLRNISGDFLPLTNLIKASYAETDFKKLGYNPQEVNLKIFNFIWDLTKVDLEADSSILNFKPYFDKPIPGKYIDKLLVIRPKSNISFPQFVSTKREVFSKFSSEISFDGSLQIIGDRLYIAAPANQLISSVKVNSSHNAYVRAVAPRFMIREFNEILSDQASIALYIDNDSITHPLSEFKYLISKREISITKTDKASGKAPFASTFHQMNIYTDKIVWNIDSSNLFLRPISPLSQKPAVLESFDYYEKGAELKYQNMGGTNPLVILDQMTKSYGVPNLVIPAADLAASMGGLSLNVKSIENLLYRLTEDGFIVYNSLDQTIRILDKTNLYIDASKRETDYDNMRFLSKNAKDNGKLSIKEKTIDFKGIEELSISESKGVYAFPSQSSLSINEDRSMNFNGEVQAGQVLFIGKDIFFDYKGFKIDFNKLDSLIIFVPSNKPDAKGNTPDIALKTVISDISGELFVDEPGNRSSRNNYEEFPYFISKDTAYIYYEKASHQNRKYSKDKFKFAIDPFRFDNLDEFKYKDISFPGTLKAPDIIEPLRASLIVMSDMSLGFEKEIAKSGVKMYNQNAFFSQKLKLNNDGLTGEGVLKFEDATMTSTSFYFFPDSVFAVLNDFKTTKNVKANIPQSSIDSAYLYWTPSKDSLIVSRLGNAFEMYDKKGLYSGDLIFQKNNVLNGIGKFEWNRGKLVSNLYNFKADALDAHNAILEIKTSDTSVNAIMVSKAEVNVDFAKNITSVNVINDSVLTELPITLLVTNASNYKWDMSAEKVAFIKQPNKSQYFLSLNKRLDSLKFEANEATYSLKENNLSAKGVTALYVADSKVIPSEGRLMIEAGGEIGIMENATIIFNAEKEFHKIDKATVDIQSSKLFKGKGQLEYKNSFGNKKSINIEEIGVKVDTIIDSKGKKGVQTRHEYTTYGVGKIYEEENFKFEDIIFYKGDVLLSSKSQDIDFDGYAKLDIQSAEYVDWFKLDQQLDPQNLEIQLANLENDRKQPVLSGLMVNPNYQTLYPAIMRAKETSQDVAIFEAKGIMKPGKVKDTYLFGEEATLQEKDLYGSKMTYNDALQTIEATGKMNLVGDLRMVKVEAYGDLNYKSQFNKTDIAATVGIDFMLEPTIWAKLASDIEKNNETTLSLAYKRNSTIKQAMYNWIADKNIAGQVVQSMDMDNYLKLPPAFPFKFVMTEVNLQWDGVDGTFKGTDRVGLVSLNNKMIEQKIKCDIEIGYRRGANEMKILLTTTSGVWYFFHLRNGNVGILSSDESMNETMRNSLKNNIVSKTEGTIYDAMVANRSAKANFDYAIQDFKERLKEQSNEKK